MLLRESYELPNETHAEIGTYILEYYAHHRLTESTSIDEIDALHVVIDNA